MSSDLDINITEVFNRYKELAGREMISAVKGAMRKAAKKLQKDTISNAKAGIKTYNNHPDGDYENYSILDAVMVGKVVDRYDEDLSIKVHVMGNYKPNSKTFRFRFLEKGTKERFQTRRNGKELTKPKSIGRINGRRYFGQAKNSLNIDQIYLEAISKAVDKINNS